MKPYPKVATQLSILIIAFSARALSAQPLRPVAPDGRIDGNPLRGMEATLRTDGAQPLMFDRERYNELKNMPRVRFAGVKLADGHSVDLDLEPFEVLAEDATVVQGTANGDTAMERPDVVLLRGTVVNEPGSSVFLALSPFGSHGWVQTTNDTFLVSSAGVASGETGTLAYSTTNLPPNTVDLVNWTCGTTTEAPRGTSKRDIVKRSIQVAEADPAAMSLPSVVYLAIDSDWEYTNSLFHGNTAASSAYAATLLAAVSEIYRRDTSTTLKISYLRVWATSADPWNASTLANQLRDLQTYWERSMRRVCRNTTHMLSGRRFSDYGGLARQPGLCMAGQGYGVSSSLNGFFPYPLRDHQPQNWDVVVVAHELGHNFGAPHTHEMSPPVDRCDLHQCGAASRGTIMSYCHKCPGGVSNLLLRFHDRTIREAILPYLASARCTRCVLCGDGLVSGSEQCDDGNTVPGDGCDEHCVREECGNKVCQAASGENCETCPDDCGNAGCGNHVCETVLGEDCISCPSDCLGKQQGNPRQRFCCGNGAGDGPIGCEDPRCANGDVSCVNGFVEPACCGNGSCDDGEQPCNCPEDCGPPARHETSCADGVDNDCDGATDCADDDCKLAPACVCSARGSTCTRDSDCCSKRCRGRQCKE